MRPTLLATLSVLALLQPGAAQTQATGATTDAFVETIEVNLVNVEVFVTDRAGNPVLGLTKEDFTLLEDGRRMELTNFYASAPPSPLAVEASPAAPAGAAPTGAAAVDEEQRLLLTVFVDNQHLSPAARDRLLPGVESFLARGLRDGDQLVLASYDGPGKLKVRRATDADPPTRIALLRETATAGPGMLGGQAQLRRILRQMELSANPLSETSIGGAAERDTAIVDAREVVTEVRDYALEMRSRSEGVLAALEQLVDGLAGLPGRKAVLYVTGGLSLRPAQAVLQAWRNRFRSIEREVDTMDVSLLAELDVDLTPELEKIAARANANRVTFYTLAAPTTVSALSAASGSGDVWTANEELAEERNVEESLHRLTGPTGGIAAVDPTDPAAMLDRMRRDFETYYSLGYQPPERDPGGTHRLEVRVNRPGMRVRFRESYRERTPVETMVDRTLATLLFESQTNPLGVVARLGEDGPGKDGHRNVPLTVQFPLDRLALLPQGGRHEGRITVYLASRDLEGGSSPVTAVKVPVRLTEEQLQPGTGRTAGYRTILEMKPIPHLVAVVVRDEIAGLHSAVTIPYAPRVSEQAASERNR